VEARVSDGGSVGNGILLPHVPREILVIGFPLVRLRVQENNALQVRQKFLGGFANERGHVVEVHTAALVQRDQQRLLRFTDRFNRLAMMNRAFSKNRGLFCGLGFVVVVLQRQEQRQIGVAIEGALICSKIDWAES